MFVRSFKLPYKLTLNSIFLNFLKGQAIFVRIEIYRLRLMDHLELTEVSVGKCE